MGQVAVALSSLQMSTVWNTRSSWMLMHIVTDGKSWSGCILVQPLEWNRNEDAFYRSPLWDIYIYGLRNRHTAVSAQCIVLFVKKKKGGGIWKSKKHDHDWHECCCFVPRSLCQWHKQGQWWYRSAKYIRSQPFCVLISNTSKASGGTEVPNTSGANPFLFFIAKEPTSMALTDQIHKKCFLCIQFEWTTQWIL